MITVRVYGILINNMQQVLVSDEWIRGMKITKFCGGGLEEGEGTRDCLIREFKEELNIEVEVGNHIYTTDYFQPSAFRKGDQILSIYYVVKPLKPYAAKVDTVPFQFLEDQIEIYKTTQQIETQRFINKNDFSAQSLTLPIDKIVAEIIITDLLG